MGPTPAGTIAMQFAFTVLTTAASATFAMRTAASRTAETAASVAPPRLLGEACQWHHQHQRRTHRLGAPQASGGPAAAPPHLPVGQGGHTPLRSCSLYPIRHD